MDDREKEIFERLRALETNRENDQEAIKLLREERRDGTATYIAILAAVAGGLGLVIAALDLVLQMKGH